jgi:zinc transporter ZupT
MRKLSWKWPAWAGFLLSVLAFVSYFIVFARFPITRNVPWVNFLLFGAAGLLFLTGLKRAFTTAGSLGGKFVSCWPF